MIRRILALLFLISLIAAYYFSFDKYLQTTYLRIKTIFIPEIVIEYDKNMLLKESKEVAHFYIKDNAFVFTRDLTPLFEKPSDEKKFFSELPVSVRVRVAHVIRNEWGNWALLQDAQTQTVLGWTYLDYLASKKSFSRVTTTQKTEFKYDLGEIKETVNISKTGKFTTRLVASGEGLHYMRSDEGELYEADPIFWLKFKQKRPFMLFFYRQDDATLSLEKKYDSFPLTVTE